MAVKPRKPALAGHTAGIFADMTLDGPEIGTLVAVVDRARNLPNRKTMGKQDPYCAMRLGKEAKKTDTDRRGGQTPKWDQELRFTVHESPDYYKLKCSVFNDDKRTDLIGEAFIDLSDLIKPGGGSNDLWHNLNYKGKYAGDVRIELTYYDLRPREEKVTEKKKPRERTPAQDTSEIQVAAPRQLGPRDVRRRPLPSSPASTTPAQTPPPVSLPQVEAPVVPPKVPLNQHEHVPKAKEYPPQREEQNIPSPYAENFPVAAPNPQQYRQPFCEDSPSTADYQSEPAWINDYNQPSKSNNQSPYASVHPSPLALTPSSQLDESDFWDQSHYSQPRLPKMSDAEHYALSRALPSPPIESQEPHYQSSRSDMSLVKHSPYRDSPLRQSMSQQETHMQVYEEPETYDAAPPPPPMHRETPPRRAQPEYPPSSFPHHDRTTTAFAPRHSDSANRSRSIDDRWSSQWAENNYDSYSPSSGPLNESFDRHSPHDSFQDRQLQQVRRSTNEHYHTPERQNFYGSYQDQMSQVSRHSPYENDTYVPDVGQTPAYQKPVYREQTESYDARRLSGHMVSVEDYRAPTFSSGSQPSLPFTEHSKSHSSRPQSSSSTPNPVPPRKAVSPASHPQPDGRRLSAIPYGPDAYDVLNPAASPVTNEGTIFQTTQQAKESSRMKEVEKLRDQGPIIGNDGRVIDPSDHLPSDTWAPEPERKARRPEHVIHVRTNNDVHCHTISNSASSHTQNNYRRQGPPPGAHVSSAPATSPSGERHRLQKKPPARPLPAQPYPQARPEHRSEPRVEANHAAGLPSQHAVEHYSSHGSPQGLYRPQLSEYQVPAGNSYIPRSSGHSDSYSSSPSRAPMQAGREQSLTYANNYENPLAAEMNMIDIGPSRGGQMVLSNRRAY